MARYINPANNLLVLRANFMDIELKTLKDSKWFLIEAIGQFPEFDFDVYERCGCDVEGKNMAMFDSPKINDKRLVLVDELKQEAIKWIKELKKAEHLTISNGLPDTDENSIVFKNTDKEALILWIKHFFNITEDELK